MEITHKCHYQFFWKS